MITLRNITLRRGVKVVLQGASVVLQPGEKVGLIGRNGAGKSSLFSLLAGRLHADAGDVEIPPRWRIGEVAQEMPETDDGATDFVLQGDVPLQQAQAALAAAEASGDGHAIGRCAPGARRSRRLRRPFARRGPAAGPGLPRATSSTRRSTASPAAGACGCSWRAR